MVEGRNVDPIEVIQWLQKTNPLVASNQSITGKITAGKLTEKLKNTSCSLTDAFASGHVKEKQVQTGQGVEKKIEKKIEKKNMNSKETLEKSVNQNMRAKTPPKKGTASSLSKYWINTLPLLKDGFVKPHTLKELGVLSQYMKVTGAHALPALEWALKNWSAFQYRAKLEKGIDVPSKPNVYSLLKCCDVAVNGYQQDQQKAVAAVKKPVQMTALKKEPLATKEEVLVILKGLK
jgi:hypothetical protein